MTMFAALTLGLLALPVSAGPAALLRVDGDHGTYVVKVKADPAVGHRLIIDCVARCRRPVSYSEIIGDSPMGLFVTDQDELIFSIWSGGSAYRVRVWAITGAGVRRVAELSSRARPMFLSDPAGRPVISTSEGDNRPGTNTAVRWTYVRGRFVRDAIPPPRKPIGD